MVDFLFSLSKEQRKIVDNIITRVPKNENELKRFFFKLENIFGFSDVRVYHRYPDASAFYDGIEINIEFEWKAFTKLTVVSCKCSKLLVNNFRLKLERTSLQKVTKRIF